MKKIIAIGILSVLFFQTAFSQSNPLDNSLLELAKIYKKFNRQTSPPNEVYAKLKSLKNPQTKTTVEFIRQAITNNNNLTNKSFLTLPDSNSLRCLYIIRQTSLRLSNGESQNSIELVKEIENVSFNTNELTACYYSMLFTAILNKNQPFNLGKTNFQLDKYGLRDEASKGIFVLQLINVCSKALYLEDTSKNNYTNVFQIIQKFPKINGLDYYKFTDFNFPDFTVQIGEKPESYKSYYMDKYFNVLFTHLDCIENCQKVRTAATKKELINTSILNEAAYRKYCRNQETLKKVAPSVIAD